MKSYIYFSARFGAQVRTTYNKHGLFVSMEIVDADDLQKYNFQEGMHRTTLHLTLDQFLAAAREKKIKITEVDRIVTFEMFWQRYDHKHCGITKAQQAWNKLSKEDQIAAFDFIKAYERYLSTSGIAKAYATTYLNQKRWKQ